MNKKIKATIVAIIFAGIILSGCVEQNDNQNTNNSDIVSFYPTYGSSDNITINSSGGIFSLLEEKLIVEIPQDSITQETQLSFSTITNSPQTTEPILISGYHFGPQDQTFSYPITGKFFYSEDEIPEDVDEENLTVYLYDQGSFVELSEVEVYPDENYVSFQISHFSEYFLGAMASSAQQEEDGNDSTSSEDDDNDSENESGAIYQFEPKIQFHEKEYRFYFDSATIFQYTAYISWEPYPWVRYYEMKVHFNGVEPEIYDGWSCNWRERGEVHCGVGPTLVQDEITYYLAPSEMWGDFKDYYGGYDYRQSITGEGTHGTSFLTIQDEFFDDEELSSGQINMVKDEIREFVENYVSSWTVTVRPVAAQSDGS